MINLQSFVSFSVFFSSSTMTRRIFVFTPDDYDDEISKFLLTNLKNDNDIVPTSARCYGYDYKSTGYSIEHERCCCIYAIIKMSISRIKHCHGHNGFRVFVLCGLLTITAILFCVSETLKP